MNLKDKITGAVKGFSIDKSMEFVKKNVRYFTAGALFVALVLILAKCTGPQDESSVDGTEVVPETEVVIQEYQVNAVPEINDLLTNYYAAYAKGNVKQLRKLATPVSKNERSYIKMFSEYVEEYRNMVCYTKPGLDDKSYLVSAYIEIKFKGVETLAPGLDFFYVSTNEKGELYIDNLYSQFNLLNNEKEMDATIAALIDNFELEADVVALQTEVQQKFEAAVSTDEALAKMVNGTIKDACAAWAQEVVGQQAAQEQNTEQTPEADTQKDTETEAPDVSEIVYAIDSVNIRAEADENAEVLATVEAGTALTRIGTAENGWSKLEYDSRECYAKSDYLSKEAPQQTEEEPEADSVGLPEGSEVMLSESVNVRASMDTSAEKLGTAFAGETVKVIMSYAEGWTKVEWNGQTGYIKTEFLK